MRDLIPDVPLMDPNADYYFSSDDVVAELKCLRTDVSNQDRLNERFLTICERLGYSAEQALRITFREVPLPHDVAKAVVRKTLKHVGNALRKASRQIAATKRLLGCEDAWGLVIISNESNISNTPVELFRFMSEELTAMNDPHIDGVIYITPNLYYPVGQDGVSRSLWLAGYRHATVQPVDFVDELGTAWCRFLETLNPEMVPSVRPHEPSLSDFDVRPSAIGSRR